MMMMISVSLHQSKVIFFVLFFLIKTLNSEPTYLRAICSNTDSYTSNSLYKSSIDSIISVFISQSYDTIFYNYTSSFSPTTTVYGTYLCRGDISSSTCATCVSRASLDIFIWCPFQKEAIIWYEECFFRFSNRPIFSILDQRRGVRTSSLDTMTYTSYFINTLEYRLNSVIREAYSKSSYFAEQTYYVSYLEEVYDLHVLVQCTQDLDQNDCVRCLKLAYSETEEYCCYGKRYVLVYSANCMLTYNATSLVPPPPPQSLYSGDDDSPTSDTSFSFNIKGKWFRKVIAPVIAVVVMILAICVCSLCCCCNKKKDKENERETPPVESSTATNIVHDNSIVDDQSKAKTESHLPN